MLKKFEIEGFKSFENKFILDLSKAHNYDSNRETVDNSIILWIWGESRGYDIRV